jgi:hypothetical protein
VTLAWLKPEIPMDCVRHRVIGLPGDDATMASCLSGDEAGARAGGHLRVAAVGTGGEVRAYRQGRLGGTRDDDDDDDDEEEEEDEDEDEDDDYHL